MTNLESIKSTVAGYPLATDTFNRVLIDRGLSAADSYLGKSQAFELATADLYLTLATAANVSEGGFQVSVNERSQFAKMATAIYDKWNESAGQTPTVTDRTEAW